MPVGDGEVNRQNFQVSYDGSTGRDGADTHSMDVQSLAPALLSMGQIFKETNDVFNGTRMEIKTLVNSEFEHKCFNISFIVIQAFTPQIERFLPGEEVKTAREILEILGFVLSS